MVKILNTISGKKEEFVPMNDKKVQMFVCGPTVYDYIHIGNARTFVFFDVVAKYLRYKGYEVDYIQNITDIDDRIIQRAKENNRDPLEWAKEYEEKFLKDMRDLGLATDKMRYVRATDHIEQVVKQVKTLIDKGHAYLIEGDGYYFDLKTFPEYGKLSKRTAQMADDAVSRIDESEKKKNSGDFALWKLSKPGEPAWDTELGKGRPGWHIEDTAITEHYFGPQYDLHGGGQDLIFPHHEAEITQQEAASGKTPFVKYWMHVAFVVNKEQKMSKSLGNFAMAHELLKKYEPEVLRFYLLTNYYRTPLEYTESSLTAAQAAIQRIYEAVNKLNNLNLPDNDNNTPLDSVKNAISEMEKAMDDDFNTPQAFGIIFEAIKSLNTALTRKMVTKDSADEFRKFLSVVSKIFGIIPARGFLIPADIQQIVVRRQEARDKKDFETSDQLRKDLKNLGYEVDDTIYGPLIKKV